MHQRIFWVVGDVGQRRPDFCAHTKTRIHIIDLLVHSLKVSLVFPTASIMFQNTLVARDARLLSGWDLSFADVLALLLPPIHINICLNLAN